MAAELTAVALREHGTPPVSLFRLCAATDESLWGMLWISPLW
jgi:hypothetical protein